MIGRASLLVSSLALFATLLLVLPACGDDGGGSSGCEPTGDQCPNYCTDGTAVEGETCGGPDDCQCGLFCKSGSCAPYEGDNAGCSCAAVGGDTGGGGGTGGGGDGDTW